MIIKKIFSCFSDTILSKVRILRRYYYRYMKCQTNTNSEADSTFGPEFYHHGRNQELTTYYVLANGENGEEGDDISPPPAIYPLTNSYIQNKYPILYNPLWNRSNSTDVENQLGYIENEETGENHHLYQENIGKIENQDVDDNSDEQQILSILDKLKQQNQELLQYLPSIPRIHP